MFGISSDSTEANAAFAKKERLPFPLLTDQNDFLRKSFGIKGNVFGMLKGRQVTAHIHTVACVCVHKLLSLQTARLSVLINLCASFNVAHKKGNLVAN